MSLFSFKSRSPPVSRSLKEETGSIGVQLLTSDIGSSKYEVPLDCSTSAESQLGGLLWPAGLSGLQGWGLAKAPFPPLLLQDHQAPVRGEPVCACPASPLGRRQRPGHGEQLPLGAPFSDDASQRRVRVLEEAGAPDHLIVWMHSLCCGQVTVRTEYGEAEGFPIGKGVRPECILPPSLFNVHTEHIIRKATLESEEGVKIGRRSISNVRYNNLLAESHNYMKALQLLF
ncbi:LINE-1 retrotransposable element ORF2 protein [Varanus komodoensis]|nr:LINE-1 retrotransposable element ORF2 protein [Varanus komodoensis]